MSEKTWREGSFWEELNVLLYSKDNTELTINFYAYSLVMGKWNTIHWKPEMRKFKRLTQAEITFIIFILI